MKQIFNDMQIVITSILLAISLYLYFENKSLKEEVYNQQEAIDSIVDSNYLDKDSLLLHEANKQYNEEFKCLKSEIG